MPGSLPTDLDRQAGPALPRQQGVAGELCGAGARGAARRYQAGSSNLARETATRRWGAGAVTAGTGGSPGILAALAATLPTLVNNSSDGPAKVGPAFRYISPGQAWLGRVG